MKVLLINPPRINEVLCGTNPGVIEKSRGYNPPLGLLYVAAALEHDHEVSVLDCQVEEIDYQQMEKAVQLSSPDIVGISAMTLTLIDVYKTAEIVKRVNSNTKVILGGCHCSLYPDETIQNENVDFLVLGEGEYVFKRLVEAIKNNDQIFDIPGIVFKCNGETVKTSSPELIDDLDKIPFPARHLVPSEKYDSVLTSRSPVTTMFTSRGCPFQCSFCARPHLGKKFRMQSSSKVIEELLGCIDMGIHEFLFYDDTFTIDKERVLSICEGIVKAGIDIRWHIRARVDTVDSEMLKLLKRSGCKGIHYGVEAGTDKILEVLNKGITVDQVRKTVFLTKQHGIPTLAYFMIGNPGETREDITKTFELAKSLNPDYVHMTILTPFPGTKIYEQALSRGVIAGDVWRDFSMRPQTDFVPPFWEENLSRKELYDLLIKGYRSFYITPRYVLDKLLGIRSFNEFKKKFTSGFRVLRLR